MWLLQATANADSATSLLEWFGIGGGSTGLLAAFYWLCRRLLNRLLTSVDDLAASVKEAHEGVGGLTHALELQGAITGQEITAMKEEATGTRKDMKAGFDRIEEKLDQGTKEFQTIGKELVAARSDIGHNTKDIKRISDRIKKRDGE